MSHVTSDLPPPPQRRNAWIDRIATVTFFVVLVGAAGGAALWAGLGVMVTDVCAYQDCPHEYRAAWGVNLAWAGIATSVIAALIGTIRAAAMRKTMCVWPAFGLFGVAGSLIVGFLVTGTAVH